MVAGAAGAEGKRAQTYQRVDSDRADVKHVHLCVSESEALGREDKKKRSEEGLKTKRKEGKKKQDKRGS